MQIGNSADRYGAIPKLIHWLSAALVVVAWTLGTFLDDFPKGPLRTTAGITHITIGEIIALLLIARLAWRVLDPPPASEVKLPQKIVLGLIYLLLLAVPLIGVAMVLSGGRDLTLFALIKIPSPFAENKELRHLLKEIHEWAANGLLALAVLHALAALVHHFKLGDQALRRMLPFGRPA